MSFKFQDGNENVLGPMLKTVMSVAMVEATSNKKQNNDWQPTDSGNHDPNFG